jgi:hypothetical protein
MARPHELKVIEPIFEETRTVGNVAKECVRALLEGSGYGVYPFGYESYTTHIKDLIHQKRMGRTETTEQLAAMPDLLVVDDANKAIELVEVKYRNRYPSNVNLNTRAIERLRKFWPNSIAVWVVPCEEVFYACRLKDLKTTDQGLGITDIDLTDQTIDKLFRKVTEQPEMVRRLKELAVKMLKSVDVGIRVE